jgi:hypothetical protein
VQVVALDGIEPSALLPFGVRFQICRVAAAEDQDSGHTKMTHGCSSHAGAPLPCCRRSKLQGMAQCQQPWKADELRQPHERSKPASSFPLPRSRLGVTLGILAFRFCLLTRRHWLCCVLLVLRCRNLFLPKWKVFHRLENREGLHIRMRCV